MRSTPLDTHAAELLWSLWTEMGVNGMVRNHSWAAIDPEPLVVATPRGGVTDPRLIEEAGRWCANHADRLSVSRLEGLLESSAESTRIEFLAFARSLHDQTKIKWPVDKWRTKFASDTLHSGSNRRKHTKRVSERLALPLRRPALFRVRMRALAGVGARADILSELVARAANWTSATDLQTLGYSKRNVARVLTELEEANVVRITRTGPGFRYRLPSSHSLAELVGPTPDAFPPWSEIFKYMVTVLDLVRIGRDTSVSNRIESTALHAALEQTATALWLESPPPIRGLRDLPDDLIEWANRQLAALAAGDSPAFRTSPSQGRQHAIEDDQPHSAPAAVKRGRSRTVRSKAR